MLYVKSVTEGMYDAPEEYVSANITCDAQATTTTYTDVLTADMFAAVYQNNKIEYKDFSGVSCSDGSPAVYAGNSAKNNVGAIQLRSTNNSGIVTTTSGGKVKKIIIQFASSTTNGRTIDVYGKSEAYTAASELYATNTSGTNIDSLKYDSNIATVELNVPDDKNYEYIGLRSSKGAIYITSITIVWEK